MKFKSLVNFLLLSVLTAGCVSHYRYESAGLVMSTSGEPSKALIYWFADEGGIWYDKDQIIPDSDVTMRVCDGIPKAFVPDGESLENLRIRSKSGDQKTAKIAGNGDIVELQQPIRLRAGDGFCGQIEVSRKKVVINDLTVSVEPEVIILCKNIRESVSYPMVGRYKFKGVTRSEIEDDRNPADFCGSE
jgi:hypothetical protein